VQDLLLVSVTGHDNAEDQSVPLTCYLDSLQHIHVV